MEFCHICTSLLILHSNYLKQELGKSCCQPLNHELVLDYIQTDQIYHYYLFIYLFIYLFVCLFIYLFTYLFIYLFIYSTPVKRTDEPKIY